MRKPYIKSVSFVLSDEVDFVYKCSDFYTPGDEFGGTCPVVNCVLLLGWNDPDLGIDWPMTDVLASEKDQNAQLLKDISNEHLPG